MNELFIYELFRSILSQSKKVEGRFLVAEGYGNDLNTNNLGDIIKDALGSITTPKKYPIVVMLPPVELVDDYETGWSRFRLELYFMNQSYKNLGNGFDTNLNTSLHPIKYDWKDMRQVAGDFRKTFRSLIIKKHLTDRIRDIERQQDIYRRISLANNDKISGVRLNFEIEIYVGCSDSEDYEANSINEIVIPEQDIHPFHIN